MKTITAVMLASLADQVQPDALYKLGACIIGVIFVFFLIVLILFRKKDGNDEVKSGSYSSALPSPPMFIAPASDRRAPLRINPKYANPRIEGLELAQLMSQAENKLAAINQRRFMHGEPELAMLPEVTQALHELNEARALVQQDPLIQLPHAELGQVLARLFKLGAQSDEVEDAFNGDERHDEKDGLAKKIQGAILVFVALAGFCAVWFYTRPIIAAVYVFLVSGLIMLVNYTLRPDGLLATRSRKGRVFLGIFFLHVSGALLFIAFSHGR